MDEHRTATAIPSAYNIISSSRSIGYSFDAAIADIIDNSLSAGATNIELFSPPGRSPCLKITDNGSGMDKEKLAEAMTFGGKINCQDKRKGYDLGRYGMGLKTASLSQCKRLEVITKKDGVLVGGCWDLDVIKKNDNWEFIVLETPECCNRISDTMLANESLESGTTVIWSKFDRLKESSNDQNDEFSRLMDSATRKLELVFHRYLHGEEGINKVQIQYNGNILVANNPFLTEKIPEISTPVDVDLNGSKIRILSHKLMHPSKLTRKELDRITLGSTLMETQGFYIYRAKRLIDYGTWFGMASKLEKTKLSRIQIDIPNTLDSEWSLDIKKSHVIPPQILRPQLRTILKNNENKSIRTFKSRKKTDNVRYPYWNREVFQDENATCKYTINWQHPLIDSFRNKLDSSGLKDEFDIILSNIAYFFPFNTVESDCQNDVKITNNMINFIDEKELKTKVAFLASLNLPPEEISSYFPGMEEKVMELWSLIDKENVK